MAEEEHVQGEGEGRPNLHWVAGIDHEVGICKGEQGASLHHPRRRDPRRHGGRHLLAGRGDGELEERDVSVDSAKQILDVLDDEQQLCMVGLGQGDRMGLGTGGMSRFLVSCGMFQPLSQTHDVAM
jgi:hypothetical protein